MFLLSAPNIPYLFAQIVLLDEASLQAVKEHSETTDHKGNVNSAESDTNEKCTV